jgi:tellurite resistance protein
MTHTIQSPLNSQQVSAWLRGLLTVAWADGHFDLEEQTLITALIHHDLDEQAKTALPEPITPTELAAAFWENPSLAENFLRTAVMVAIADGVYSVCEDEVLFQFCHALELDSEILKILRETLSKPYDTSLVNDGSTKVDIHTRSDLYLTEALQTDQHSDLVNLDFHHPSLLQPVRDWLDQMDIQDPKVAHFLCKMIPSQCPFERDINLLGRKVFHVPPLCKLNPLYEQLVSLRFRALSYLADRCGEDVSSYC